jgi:hypothetical protein
MANLSNISNDCAHAQYSIPSTQSNVVPLQAASNVTSEDHTIYGTGISTIQVAQDRVILSSGDGICFGKLDSPPKILIIYTERNVQSKN